MSSPTIVFLSKKTKGRTIMSRSKSSAILSVVHHNCCGLDIHKDKILAALVITEDDGGVSEEIREFGAFTDDLYQLKQWLLDAGCHVVAMESTGVYWRPVHNVLEDLIQVILVNARHVKNLPGRKTDVSDSRWLAGLLRHGLLRGSFIPGKHVREWRDLSRLRRVFVDSLSDYKRRVHKLFESANIKIDSIASDLFGVTGRNLIDILVSGKEIMLEDICSCTRGRLKGREDELFKSIRGFFTEHHRFQLVSILTLIKTVETQITAMHDRLRGLLSDRKDKIKMIMEVPGISNVSVYSVLSEIGDTLEQFETSSAITSWCGLCPGNNESAGKRHSGRSPVKSNHLKTIMVEVAWGAVKSKGSYYREKYYSLKARIGSRKAIIAIARRILKAIFHILKYGVPYRELGEQYLINLNHEARLKNLSKQAAKLGYAVVPLTE
jgi:transposase